MTAISIDIVSKHYRSGSKSPPIPVIHNLRLEARAGEFVCLVGPSGCGKTTLLNIVAGLDRDYIGCVALETETAQPRLGYIFQNPRLLPWRTVDENVVLALPDDHDPALYRSFV